ncbi:MAG TPA: hypothetical protein VGX71_21395 [Pseudaminobacter sp.]|nr:hypothetical protein [Pseudaminobacter sp.]
MGEVDLACLRVQKVKLLVLLELDSCSRQGCFDADRRLMVDQEAVDHRLAMGVTKDGLAENVGRVQGTLASFRAPPSDRDAATLQALGQRERPKPTLDDAQRLADLPISTSSFRWRAVA